MVHQETFLKTNSLSLLCVVLLSIFPLVGVAFSSSCVVLLQRRKEEHPQGKGHQQGTTGGTLQNRWGHLQGKEDTPQGKGGREGPPTCHLITQFSDGLLLLRVGDFISLFVQCCISFPLVGAVFFPSEWCGLPLSSHGGATFTLSFAGVVPTRWLPSPRFRWLSFLSRAFWVKKHSSPKRNLDRPSHRTKTRLWNPQKHENFLLIVRAR